jgi:hypothetical protein
MITIVRSCKKNGYNEGTRKGFTLEVQRKDTYEITLKKTGKCLEERKELTRTQKKGKVVRRKKILETSRSINC